MYRFGPFELDPRAHELRRGGVRIKLQKQSFLVLLKLLENPGALVTREELYKSIWPADTFVDFETGLNKVIKRLREALGDSAEAPKFIETAPKLGYRFVAPVETFDRKRSGNGSLRARYYVPAAVVAVAILGALTLWKTAFDHPGPPRVLRFTALTNDGQAKNGPMVTDGSRVYFNEVLPGPREVVVQVSVKGGDVIPLSIPLQHPYVLDVSKDATELLIANSEPNDPRSLWLQPVAGGSPRRVGNIFADDAQFASGGNIIYSVASEVHLTGHDGSSTRRLFSTQGYPHAFRFAPDEKTFRFSLDDPQIDATKIMEAAADGSGLHEMFPVPAAVGPQMGSFSTFRVPRTPEAICGRCPKAGIFYRPSRITAPFD